MKTLGILPLYTSEYKIQIAWNKLVADDAGNLEIRADKLLEIAYVLMSASMAV